MPARVLLTTTTNSFEAKVIAAHLRAEGLEPELVGAVDGPYPFVVGDMAQVSVWVPEDQLDDARLVMLAAEVDSAVTPPSRHAEPPTWTWAGRFALALVLALLAVSVLARLVALE